MLQLTSISRLSASVGRLPPRRCSNRPPHEITADENQVQEDEANALAFEWLNGMLTTRGLAQYSQDELAAAQKRMQQKMLDENVNSI